ncbi:MAG: hypothetical protein GY810_22965 [Aureispira sp.]|nr:hypothetical protein [Aureispira sp.]
MRLSLILTLICYLATSSIAQNNDSLIVQLLTRHYVYKNLETNLYYITEKDSDIVKIKDLNYVVHLIHHSGSYLQVLDSQNNSYILDDEFKKIEKPHFYGLCGTVPHYTYRIVEQDNYFVITEDETFMDAYNETPAVAIDSIPKKGIKNIYFPNKTKEVSYSSNLFSGNYTDLYPNTILIEKGCKTGILNSDKTINYYKEVVGVNHLLKVKKNGLWGYYGITKKPKYKKLEPFHHTLARFELKNGKTGYIDTQGNEYYKR